MKQNLQFDSETLDDAEFMSRSLSLNLNDTNSDALESFKLRLSEGQELLVGSPDYVDPQVTKGERFDESADVFAFGVVLLECLCGMRVSGILEKCP